LWLALDAGTRHFLDYLGFERDTLKPLLVVEVNPFGSRSNELRFADRTADLT
jgi:hypothetical protein